MGCSGFSEKVILWFESYLSGRTFKVNIDRKFSDPGNLNFSSLFDWFINNKLSIHLGEDKTKSILFGTKLNIKRAEPLNIVYGNIKIKQYIKVLYLGCILDESLLGESMALHVFNKINSRLRFLYRQNDS